MQEKLTFTYNAILNFYIAYEINLREINLHSKFTLANSLFSAVKLAKNTNPLFGRMYKGLNKYNTSVFSSTFI